MGRKPAPVKRVLLSKFFRLKIRNLKSDQKVDLAQALSISYFTLLGKGKFGPFTEKQLEILKDWSWNGKHS